MELYLSIGALLVYFLLLGYFFVYRQRGKGRSTYANASVDKSRDYGDRRPTYAEASVGKSGEHVAKSGIDNIPREVTESREKLKERLIETYRAIKEIERGKLEGGSLKLKAERGKAQESNHTEIILDEGSDYPEISLLDEKDDLDHEKEGDANTREGPPAKDESTPRDRLTWMTDKDIEF